MKTIVPKSKNKYYNKQTIIHGHVFDSIKESERFLELTQWEKEGKIVDLKLQPVFELQTAFIDDWGKKHQAIKYIADFSYFGKLTLEEMLKYKTNGNNILTIEDTKGFKTEVYRIKKKLLLYKYPAIKFIES